MLHKLVFLSLSFFLFAPVSILYMSLERSEEDILKDIEQGQGYGATHQTTSSPQVSESITNRKRHRMQQRQYRPKMLVDCFHPSDKSLNKARLSPDLVLPALDPRYVGQTQTDNSVDSYLAVPKRSLSQKSQGILFQDSLVLISVLLEQNIEIKRDQRGIALINYILHQYIDMNGRYYAQNQSLRESIKYFLEFNPYITRIKNLLFAKKTIILFVSRVQKCI